MAAAHATSEACPTLGAAALKLAPSALAVRAGARPAGWQRTSQASVRAVYVVIVEPNATARSLLAARLRKEHLEIQETSSAEEAMTEIVRSGTAPVAVVTEVELPGIDGFGLCELLRAEHCTAEVPVFILARPSMAEPPWLAFASGADDYFRKPVFVDDIAARVALECGRAAAGTFVSNTESLPLPRLVRALLAGSSSGRLELADGRGGFTFSEGRVTACTFQSTSGAEAVERLLALGSGAFQVCIGRAGPGELSIGLEDLCSTILPKLQRWWRLSTSGVPLDARLEVQFAELPRWLPELPHDIHRLLSLLDGRRRVRDVVADSPYPEVTTLEVLTRLYALGIADPSVDPAKATPPEPPVKALGVVLRLPTASELLNELPASHVYLPDRLVFGTALFLAALAGTVANGLA